MHGCGLEYALLVNAEVDSMGGIVDSGVGIGNKTSPRRAAIENAQTVLRQEYDVREEKRRELEFLEKGGNPLDFKIGHAVSISVQSTSLTDQHPEQFVISDAKGSFACTASPHGDSVESIGRPGAPPLCEPNSADNLMLFDGENEFLEHERNLLHPNRSNIAPSEQSSQLDGSEFAKESGDSAALGLPRKAYRRRNRSRPSRDGTRSSSTDVVLSRSGPGSSTPSRPCPKDAKGLLSDTDYQKKETLSSNCCPKPTSPKANMVLNTSLSGAPLNMELDGVQAKESTADMINGVSHDASTDINAMNNRQDGENDQQPQVNDEETPVEAVSPEPETCEEGEQVISAGCECAPSEAMAEVENQAVLGQINGFISEKGETKGAPNQQNSSATLSTKGLDSESSCTQASHSLDGNNDSELCTDLRTIETNGVVKEPTLASRGSHPGETDDMVKIKTENKDEEISVINTDNLHSVDHKDKGNGSIEKVEEELNEDESLVQNEVKCSPLKDGMELNGPPPTEIQTNPCKLLVLNSTVQNNATNGRLQVSADLSTQRIPEAMVPVKGSVSEQQTCSGVILKPASKEHEDSILEEARIIEAKRKMVAELSVGTLPLENWRKSHWDFVLEEMMWLANDFAQERVWKITTAAQICHRVAVTSRLKLDKQNSNWKAKKVAHTLANAVIGFWHSAEEASKEPELQYPEKDSRLAVFNYAIKYLKDNSLHVPHEQAEAPATPDRIIDVGILDVSWEDHLTEENLFYAVPPGAMEIYRNSIESHLLQFEKIGNIMQEEVETSGYDAVAELESQENAYEEDGEASTYYLPGAFDTSKSSKFAQKKRKNFMRPYAARSYEGGADLPYDENKFGSQRSVLIGKRPANSLNVSIPTKRVRTPSRQRVLSPFNAAGTSGFVQAPSRNNASSGDTNSFQDDQNSLHGGSQIPNSLEVESLADFEKQLPFDSAEVSMKPKKKKKAKHLGSTYEQRWHLDSNYHNEQRDHSRKRLECHQFESNGSSGLFGQPIVKKLKIMRQPLDNSFDNLTPISDSIPSPVASQTSNMSNPNKFIRMLGGRERGRKTKSLKLPAGQPGCGSPWSLFEDQALVVLVHDMGPNWELVSDAINSSLQFRCIFRKPKECKERHKVLMDRTTGDGADSAEDSGSSQPYPSTLPGIPKGSARQLFQRLQGPMEEDTLKSHFEKIIMIGQKLHHRRAQNDFQDPKLLQQHHNSHTAALSLVCPNNLNGGPILTPLDLCDTTVSSPEVLPLGYQGTHSGGIAISSQGAVASMLPAAGANPTAQGSSNMVIGGNFSSPSGPLNATIRDGRYAVPRSASLSIDEQQRMQQYNQMLSGRGIQQSTLSVPGALPSTEHSVRMVPGGNGMGIMCGVNRSVPMVRPAYQGIPSPSMLNSGSMLSSATMAMPSPVNMHSGGSSGQGNSMLRPRDALHMMRPGQNPEHQRQMMVPDLQMQVSQGNSQGISPFGGSSSSFPNQTAPPPMQSFPLHQQAHPMSPQQSHVLGNSHNPHLPGPNHATIRVAKERHMQQHLMQQQQPQQQFSASNALMPHVQPQAQLSISSPLQNSSQIPSQSLSPSVSQSPVTPSNSMTPLTQQQQKHSMQPHGPGRNTQAGGSGVTNQMGKQRQRQQQFQQAGRHHTQQRQQSQSQQQAKLLKGVGRGNTMMHQNFPIDPFLNGHCSTQGSQSVEKGDPAMHLMQNQGLYSASGVNSVQSPKQFVHPHSSNQTQPQQKIYPGQTIPSSKQLQQIPSHADNSNLVHVPNVTPASTLSAAQTVSPLVISSASNQQLQQKVVNQTQPAVQRVLQHNRQVNSDSPNKLQVPDAQPDQLAANNASQMETKPMPWTSIDATNIIPVASSTPWKASQQSYDSAIPDSAIHLSSMGTQPLTSSAVNETTPPTNPALGQRQSSGSLFPLGHDGGAQWQQQSSQLQLPTTPPPPQQSQQQSVQSQLPTLQQSQQTKLLQAGSTSLYVKSTSSRLE